MTPRHPELLQARTEVGTARRKGGECSRTGRYRDIIYGEFLDHLAENVQIVGSTSRNC